MKKNILVASAILFSGVLTQAQNMQKAVLVDFGGKSIVLYGFTDYKKTSDYLKSKTTGVVLPTPYTKGKTPALTADGKPDYQNGVYAMVSIVRADNRYAETGFNNDTVHDQELAKKNPRGIYKPEIMTQANLTFYVTNPAEVNSVYMDGTTKYNPDALGMVLDHFYTSHARFSEVAKTVWSNKSQMGITEPLTFDVKSNNSVLSLTAQGYFKDAQGNMVIDLQMKESTLAVTELDRNWKANIIAGNDAETTLYPANSVDHYYQRAFDKAVDTYTLGGPVKTVIENLKFEPFIWQVTAYRTAEVFFNYAP